MNVLARSTRSSAVGVVDDLASLTTFLEPHMAATILRRAMPAAVHSWLEGLDPEKLPRGRVILQPNAVEKTLTHLGDIYGLPPGSERDWLYADIASLADAFAGLMSARFLRLRLDVVTTNACRRFHVDAITARLVCTYRGTGTQYGISVDGTDPSEVSTVSTGCPILLRGTQWPAKPDAGLLHRSPPIEGTGEARLVLVLDAVDDPDSEPDYTNTTFH